MEMESTPKIAPRFLQADASGAHLSLYYKASRSIKAEVEAAIKKLLVEAEKALAEQALQELSREADKALKEFKGKYKAKPSKIEVKITENSYVSYVVVDIKDGEVLIDSREEFSLPKLAVGAAH